MKLASPKTPVTPAPNASLPPKPPANLTELLALPRDRIESCDVALLNLLCAEGLPGAENLSVADGLTTLDQWTRQVDFETRRHLYRFRKNPAEFEHSEAKFRMLMLGVVLQTHFGVRYNPDRITPAGVFEPNDVFFADSRDVLLHGLVGDRRMGTCSSLPVLYVAIGRRLGYPLKLVTTKTHLLARWDTPTARFNIEASGRGVGWYDDEHFKQWPVPVSEEEIAAWGLLKSMTPAQELATFLSIRGSCLLAKGRAEDAVASYEHAGRLDPDSLGHRLLLAAARQSIAELARPSGAGPSTAELSPDALHEPTPSPLPGGELAAGVSNKAPLLGGAGSTPAGSRNLTASARPPLPARNEWGEDRGGQPIETALLSPALSSLCREEREKSKQNPQFHSVIQQQWVLGVGSWTDEVGILLSPPTFRRPFHDPASIPDLRGPTHFSQPFRK